MAPDASFLHRNAVLRREHTTPLQGVLPSERGDAYDVAAGSSFLPWGQRIDVLPRAQCQ